MITATPTPFSILLSLSETTKIAIQTSTLSTSILETATTQLIDVMFTSSVISDVITTSFFAMPSHPNSFTASGFTQTKQMERQSPPVLPLQTSVVTSHSLVDIFAIDSSMFTHEVETSQEIMILIVSSTFLGGFQTSPRVTSLSLGDQLQATKSVVITASASAGFEHVSSTVDSPSNLSITQASTSSMSLLNNINMSTVSPLMSLPTSLTRPPTINATEMVANSFSPIVKPSTADINFQLLHN
ncbi:mucin-2-like [Corticium candelabrum]|uniref:mucin-2-like n=1 Tax=Corticium candelabrum TaxID=121492 RepID=UPI002E258C1F|nr:mucin-2-like [Corticium candelabrum]